MELGSYSEDQLDQLIVKAESEIGTWRVVEMAAIAEKRRRKSHLADGYRTIVDWTAARADVSHETARSLCWTATRLGDAPEVAVALASGEISFDRAEQLARLPSEHRDGHEGCDIAQLRRLVADHKRLTRRRERKMGNGFLQFGHADELATSYWGELPGLDARIVEKAVDQRADEIIPADQRLAVAERRALALVSILQDSLYQGESSEGAAPVDVAVIVDAETAAESNGEKGISVLAGARLGPGMLEEILCKGNVDLVGITGKGRPLDLGRRSRTVGRKLRRHVLHRDGGCTVEGCYSRYRLEVHHVVPWSHGGRTDADNLITLCWFHHHVSAHREGLQIIRLGVSRVRLKRPR
jgi:HNH endonuclease/Domain of unknown function (DUF222)